MAFSISSNASLYTSIPSLPSSKSEEILVVNESWTKLVVFTCFEVIWSIDSWKGCFFVDTVFTPVIHSSVKVGSKSTRHVKQQCYKLLRWHISCTAERMVFPILAKVLQCFTYAWFMYGLCMCMFLWKKNSFEKSCVPHI